MQNTDNRSLPIQQKDYQLFGKIVTSLLLITVAFLYIPFNAGIPSTSLDASWEWAMNEATKQHLVFGKDIIFTFGPYASVNTRIYHPGTDHLMLLGSIPIAFFAIILVYNLAKSRSILWKLLFTGFLASGLFSRDVHLFLYPLFVAVYLYNTFVDKLNNIGSSNSKKLFCISLFIPFGIMLLVKGSFLILIAGITLLSAALFWYRNMKKTAVAICIVPILSMLIFQIAASQPISALWYYIKNMLPIISGFTEAMSLHGDKKEVLLFIITSLLILLTCYKIKDVPAVPRLFLAFSLSLFLFTAFKAGFTRHDGHALAASASLLSLGFILYSILQRKTRTHVLFLMSVATWVYIDHTYVGDQIFNIVKPVPTLYTQSFDGLLTRLKGGGVLKSRFDQRVNEIKNGAIKIPVLNGTTDVYSYEQAYLFSSGNTWSPRPIIQSYSVYTEKLAQLNEAHLTSRKAPNNIIFAVQPIDYRFPSMEDGLSWPTIINNYQPDHIDDRFLYLKQKRSRNITPKQEVLYNLKCKLGEEIVLPDTTQVLFARFDIKQTMPGKASNTIYRPDPVEIFITLVDGSTSHYRFIPAMAKSGFIFTPVVSDAKEFAQMFGQTDSLKNKFVRSFRVANDGLGLRSFFNTWEKEYTVQLSRIIYDK